MSRLTFGTTPITFPKQCKRGGTFMITQLAILQGKWEHRTKEKWGKWVNWSYQGQGSTKILIYSENQGVVDKQIKLQVSQQHLNNKVCWCKLKTAYKSLFSLLAWPPYCISVKHCLRPQHSVITRLQYNSRCGYLWNDKTCHQRMSCKSDIPQLRQPHMLEAVHV